MKKSLKKLQDLTKNFVNLMGESSSMHMKGVQNTIEVFVSKFVKGFESEGEISKQSALDIIDSLLHHPYLATVCDLRIMFVFICF